MKLLVALLFLSFYTQAKSGLTADEFSSITGFQNGVYQLDEVSPHSDECLGAGEMAIVEDKGYLRFIEEAAGTFEISNIEGKAALVKKDGNCATEFQPARLNRTTKILLSEWVRVCNKGEEKEIKTMNKYEVIFLSNRFIYKVEKTKTGEPKIKYSCTMVSESATSETKEPLIEE